MEPNRVLWTPTDAQASATNLAAFLRQVADDGAPVDPNTDPVAAYRAAHRWSIDHPDDFWAQVWDRCGVAASRRFEAVREGTGMPGTRWFPGARLNYAENLLGGHQLGENAADPDRVAVIGAGEGRSPRPVSLAELRTEVARLQAALRRMGVGEGDRVCAFTPNDVEALALMLAATGLGAVWSSTSPDFGVQGVVDRFAQVEPAVLLVADGYRYNGRTHALQDKVQQVVAALPTLRHVVVADFAGVGLTVEGPQQHAYDDLVAGSGPAEPTFVQVAPDHPLFIMYSSGTTGVPKSIVHGHAGTLGKHLVEHQLHSDIRPGDVVMWFTTCGWMMWNWLVSALASHATVVLYDGSPTHPDAGVLWRLAADLGVTHFGTSPKFLAACENLGLRPGDDADLSAVRAVLSTGAPLNPEQFDWVYDAVAEDIQLASVSGGTDLIGCFAGGVPTLPVRRGELQGLSLGMAVEAWDEEGRPVGVGEKGELVCTRPFPSTPVGFFGDPDGSRYRAAYFEQNPGVWTHGDYIEIRPEGGVIIYGRSDTTLNPGGVRIGTAEIYRAIEPLTEVEDSIVVGRDHEGDVEVVLCVKLAAGVELDDDLVTRIRTAIRTATTPRHVPSHVFSVPDIPYTISGKKVEKAVRTAIAGGEVSNRDALANPDSLAVYRRLFAAE